MNFKSKIFAIVLVAILCANFTNGQIEYRLLNLDQKHQNAALQDSLKQLRMTENEIDASAISAQTSELLANSPKQSLNGLMAIGAKLEEDAKASEALAIYEKITAMDNNYAPAHNAAAGILFEIGDINGAIAHLRSSTKISPNDFNAWFGLGTILEQSGDLKGAKAAYEKAIYLNPFLDGAKRGLYKIDAQTKGLPM